MAVGKLKVLLLRVVRKFKALRARGNLSSII